MARRAKKTFAFGEFLKELRERKGVSLKDVENDTKIPNAYLSQLETGARRKLPDPHRLAVLAEFYNVTVEQLLEKAGYIQAVRIEETMEQKIKKAFLHVINDPKYKYGTRLKDAYDLDTKRFVVEMYEKATGKKLLD